MVEFFGGSNKNFGLKRILQEIILVQKYLFGMHNLGVNLRLHTNSDTTRLWKVPDVVRHYCIKFGAYAVCCLFG